MGTASGSESTNERVAILRRLKEHLLLQRGKFQSYLDVLVKEEASIRNGDLEALSAQVNLEQGIVEEIYAFQKVIDPLQDLYRVAYPTHDPEIPSLQASLDNLLVRVLAHNEHNRTLLRDAMANLRQEIQSLRTPKLAKSPYGDVDAPSVIDIQT